MQPPLVVIDTMIIARALFGAEGSPNYKAVLAVETGEVRLAVSDDFLRELTRVVQYENVRPKITDPILSLRIGLFIGVMCYFHTPESHEWPTMADEDDWWVLDLAFESGADYIVTEDKHFRGIHTLGFKAITARQLLEIIPEAEVD